MIEVESSDKEKCIWTIGHSTRTQEEFVQILRSFQVEVLIDVRRYPGSRKYPQFNVAELESYLPEVGVKYIGFDSLGGRRKPIPDSKNTIWRNEAFRGYADYTETTGFKDGLKQLVAIALQKRTAYMCSEAVWWRCHRAIISDILKEAGWKVLHIMKEEVVQEHPYTAAYLSTHTNCQK